jgi:hypothetical protein
MRHSCIDQISLFQWRSPRFLHEVPLPNEVIYFLKFIQFPDHPFLLAFQFPVHFAQLLYLSSQRLLFVPQFLELLFVGGVGVRGVLFVEAVGDDPDGEKLFLQVLTGH